MLRYDTRSGIDGLPDREGAFLACTFWLVDACVMMGRLDDARRLFERLLTLRNDVGLLSEEYDPVSKRLVGNFPQAFPHIPLIDSAHNLTSARSGPSRGHQRPRMSAAPGVVQLDPADRRLTTSTEQWAWPTTPTPHCAERMFHARAPV